MEEWVPRNGEQHKFLAAETLKASTKKAQSELEAASGVRYSELFRLPYFDPISGHIIDPMHNLLLGSAKHTFNVWVEKGLIDGNKMAKIDSLMHDMGRSSEIGRTTKTMNLSSTMKAEEWRSWVSIFSIYCLKDLLPRADYNVWQLFIRACNLLLKPYITKSELEDAHQLLLLYCKKFQEIYGMESCTPNMHLHLHLKDCIKNFGPVYGFWAFSFERYNGILGAYHTNNRSVTITMMRKFIDGVRIVSTYQQLQVEDLPPLSDFELMNEKSIASYAELAVIRSKDVLTENDLEITVHSLIAVPKLDSLSEYEKEKLAAAIAKHFPQRRILQLSKFTKSFDRVKLGKETICTEDYRKGASPDRFVMTRIDGNVHNLQPAVVCKILIPDVSFQDINEEPLQMMFLKLRLFEEHDKKRYYGERSPMTVWSTIERDEVLVPINFIHRKASFTRAQIKFESTLVSDNKRSRIQATDVVYFVI